MAPLFDLVLSHVPAPRIEEDQSLPHAGHHGRVGQSLSRPGADRPYPFRVRSVRTQTVKALFRDCTTIETGRISRVLALAIRN